MNKKLIILSVIIFVNLLLSGCGGESAVDEGVVIAPKSKIRSSTAPVALDVAEVKRGDKLDILDQAEVRTPTRVEEWYRVRTRGKDSATGWIESRSVINKAVVSKIDTLFDQSKSILSQGTGRLKVQTRLRVEPSNEGDVATLLSRGTDVEIVGTVRTTYKPDRIQSDSEAAEAEEEPETRTVLWYQVRLPETEVLRAGFVGAQQVQLDVPDEILHLEGDGRRFTGWIVFDQTKLRTGELKNNYIGLMKGLGTEGPIDFTRIWVLNYNPDTRRYNGSYIEGDLRGVLPITLGTASGRKGFSFQEIDANNKPVAVEYELVRDSASHVRVKRLSPKIQVKKPRR